MTSDEQVGASAEVCATPQEVFALLRDPSTHARFDGSGTVLSGRASDPIELKLGDRFHLAMQRWVRYRMWNSVVEFEQDRRIAWRQEWGHHVRRSAA